MYGYIHPRSSLRSLLPPLVLLVVETVFWFSVFWVFCFVLIFSISTEGKVFIGWPPLTPRAFRSEIIWWNPCILTPLSHNEALQSKPLSLFLTGVPLVIGSGVGVGKGWLVSFVLFSPPVVDFYSWPLNLIWPFYFNYHHSTGKLVLKRAICKSPWCSWLNITLFYRLEQKRKQELWTQYFSKPHN